MGPGPTGELTGGPGRSAGAVFLAPILAAALGQGLLLAAMTLVSRAFTPGAIGAYGVLHALLALLLSVGALRFDQAIVHAPRAAMADDLARLARRLALWVPLLLLLPAWGLFLALPQTAGAGAGGTALMALCLGLAGWGGISARISIQRLARREAAAAAATHRARPGGTVPGGAIPGGPVSGGAVSGGPFPGGIGQAGPARAAQRALVALVLLRPGALALALVLAALAGLALDGPAPPGPDPSASPASPASPGGAGAGLWLLPLALALAQLGLALPARAWAGGPAGPLPPRRRRAVIRANRAFPLWNLPHNLVFVAGEIFVPLALAWSYGTGPALALYWLAARVVSAPATVLVEAIRPQLTRRLADSPDPLPLALRCMALLLLPVLPGIAVLWLAGGPLLATVFGPGWAAAAPYALVLGGLAASAMAALPAVALVPRLGLQRRQFGVELAGLGLRAALFLGPGWETPLEAVTAATLGYALLQAGFALHVLARARIRGGEPA